MWLTLSGLACAKVIDWTIGGTGVKAMPNWRTTISNMCEFKKDVEHR